MSNNDALPCPFCGGEVDPEGWLGGDGTRGPECDVCGATACDMASWNRRASNNDALRKALESAQDFINDVHFGEWSGGGGRRNEVQAKIAKGFEALAAGDESTGRHSKASIPAGVEVAFPESKPEPQAQAEPEVVAKIRKWAEGWASIPYEDPWKHAANEILTLLESHQTQSSGAWNAVAEIPNSLRIALENFDSMESLGPTTEAVIGAAQKWYLSTARFTHPQPTAQQALKPLTEEYEAFKEYLADCDACAIVPDVGGAFHAAWNAAHGITGKDQA